MEMLEELEKDYHTLVSRINFKDYDPLDPNFMKASVVGLMWLVGNKLMCNDVEEELDGAEKYFRLYEETGDAAYKTMATDELRHAETLIKKHLANVSDSEVREVLNGQDMRRLEMAKMISSATIPVKSIE